MQVAVHTTSGRGFSPEEIAERYADKIIHVADSADPVIQQQARAFRKQLVQVLQSALKEAVQSDRTTVYNALNEAGQPQLADLIRRL
jgi:HD superfamily phosphohydrolase YqeK